MDDFKVFADAINKKFLELSANGTLLRVNVPKEQLWATYQAAYSAKDNPIFRERKVHECNTCYSFIKRLGALVGINKAGNLDTIWNVSGLPAPYQGVANTMHELVYAANITSIFLTDEALVGKEYNIEENEAGNIKWEHFYADVDKAFISQDVAATVGSVESTVSVFKRALDEFSVETLESVIDLCDTIYKGIEFQPTVTKFLAAKQAYEAGDKNLFIWTEYKNYPAKIRNSAIGSLIINIQEGMELELAVTKYEQVVAPSNYKRTSAIVTEGMKKQAVATIDELGLRDSLPRRHAELVDVSVNNVLFADASAQAVMQDSIDDLFDSTVSKSTEAPKKAVELTIEQFLEKVLPNSKSIELLLENKHTPNLVSLVAPVNPEAPNMLKWNNNFSWSYAGEMTDSDLTQRVQQAGGRVDGVFRFTHSWNELEPNKSLMDLHVFMPGCTVPSSGGGPNVTGRRVGWNQRTDSASGGTQDVDYIDAAPTNYIPVENITFPDINRMPKGTYTCKIHNWSFRGSGGKGRAEIAFAGQKFEYVYPATKDHEWITIAEVTLKNGEFTINHKLPCSTPQKTEWNLNTKQYHRVSTIMLSPNHWDGQTIGNKHYFFMLDGCSNPDPVRGFYNEFLSEDLRPHRKVFEVLSSKMKCTPAKEQLSGLGFSSTQRNELFLKVDNRPYKITF